MRKRNPSSRPTNSPSTVTSPLSFTSATRLSFCFSRRSSTDGAPVDKSLRQRAVQRIRQAVFYRAGLLAPMGFRHRPSRCVAPHRSMCGYRPAASTSVSMSPAVRSMRATCPRQPVVGHPAAFVQEAEDPGQQAGMLGLAECRGNRACGRHPTAAARRAGCGTPVADLGPVRAAPSARADRRPRAPRRQPFVARCGASSEAISRSTVPNSSARVAPHQPADRRRSGGSRWPRPALRPAARASPVTPKVPGVGVAPGAAGDLGQLVREQRAHAAAVELRPSPRRRRGGCRGSAPCRWRRWRPGNRPRRSGTSPPARCACAATARPSPPRSRPSGGAAARRWHRRSRPRTRRWRERGGIRLSFFDPV